MTIRQKLEKQLFDNGMFEMDATIIINNLECSEQGEPMRGRWDEDETNYPQVMLKVLWLSARAEAIKWIDENKPNHWARPMFVD